MAFCTQHISGFNTFWRHKVFSSECLRVENVIHFITHPFKSDRRYMEPKRRSLFKFKILYGQSIELTVRTTLFNKTYTKDTLQMLSKHSNYNDV